MQTKRSTLSPLRGLLNCDRKAPELCQASFQERPGIAQRSLLLLVQKTVEFYQSMKNISVKQKKTSKNYSILAGGSKPFHK